VRQKPSDSQIVKIEVVTHVILPVRSGDALRGIKVAGYALFTGLPTDEFSIGSIIAQEAHGIEASNCKHT